MDELAQALNDLIDVIEVKPGNGATVDESSMWLVKKAFATLHQHYFERSAPCKTPTCEVKSRVSLSPGS